MMFINTTVDSADKGFFRNHPLGYTCICLLWLSHRVQGQSLFRDLTVMFSLHNALLSCTFPKGSNMYMWHMMKPLFSASSSSYTMYLVNTLCQETYTCVPNLSICHWLAIFQVYRQFSEHVVDCLLTVSVLRVYTLHTCLPLSVLSSY